MGRGYQYIRTNRFGQEVKKRTFEFPTDLLEELNNLSRQLKRPVNEFVVEAVKEKMSAYKV